MSAPVVTWVRRGCGCWVLRAHLTPAGWEVHLRARVHRPDAATLHRLGTPAGHRWLRRTKHAGLTVHLPLDVAAWRPFGALDVGCTHGRGALTWEALREDVRSAVQARSTMPPRRVLGGPRRAVRVVME